MMKILKRSRIGAIDERLDDDLADGVDAGVGGAVDLEHVDVAAFGDFGAGVARRRTARRRSVHAVERARQDARRGRLAHAARPGKDERLRQPAGRDGVLQRVDDAALADDVFEPLRTPLAGESEVRHGHEVMESKDAARPTAARRACGTAQDRLSAAAFRP